MIVQENETRALILSLIEEAIVFGLLRDADGLPVGLAEVSLVADRNRDRPETEEGVYCARVSTFRTAQDGIFRFEGLGSSSGELLVQVVARHPDFAVYESNRDAVQNGTEHGPLLCVMKKGGELWGTMTSNGLPHAGAIKLTGPQTRKALVEDDGSYRIDSLPPGAWTLTASLEEHRAVAVSMTVRVDANTSVHQDVSLDYDMEAIWGDVKMQSGFPVEGAKVVCEPREWSLSNRPSYVGRTAADGSFSVEVPVQREAKAQEYAVRLARWDDDCAIAGIFPPQRVAMSCGDSAVLICQVASSKGTPAVDLWVSWLAEERIGEEELALSPDEYEPGHFKIIVPAGKGLLRIGASDDDMWSQPLSLQRASTTSMGAIQLKASH